MNSKIIINQSVAILCDGNNIERSLHEKTGQTGAMLNFDIVIPKLLNGRGLKRLIYFREGKNISNKLAERLYENYYGSVVPCHKSADIPLSIKATQLASKVDTIIILSGDSDYVELVDHLKNEGVRVEIAAVRQNAARILLDAADYFHEIREGDFFVYNKGRPNRVGPVKSSVTKTKPAVISASNTPAQPPVISKTKAPVRPVVPAKPAPAKTVTPAKSSEDKKEEPKEEQKEEKKPKKKGLLSKILKK